MSDKIKKLQDLMDCYWSAAHEQGTYMGSEDDANRKAENAERELLEFVSTALADERKRALEEAAALCHSRANDMLLLKSTEMAIANNLSSHFMERHNWYCDLATDICALKETTK